METKESKVKSITPSGTWDSPNGLLYKWEIEMENGDVGIYQSQTDTCKKFKEGESYKYLFEDGKFPKIKPFSEKPENRSQGYKQNPELQRKIQIMIVLQSSLKEANMFHSIVGFESASTDVGNCMLEIMNTMETFADRILKNKYLK